MTQAGQKTLCDSAWTDSITSQLDGWMDSGVSDLAVFLAFFFWVVWQIAVARFELEKGLCCSAVETGAVDRRSNGNKLTLTSENLGFLYYWDTHMIGRNSIIVLW